MSHFPSLASAKHNSTTPIMVDFIVSSQVLLLPLPLFFFFLLYFYLFYSSRKVLASLVGRNTLAAATWRKWLFNYDLLATRTAPS